jgi:HlyD family secretion protein
LTGLLVLALIGFAVWFLMPKPVLVDLDTVRIGTLEITVSEEAKTRVRNVYTVSAPVAGRVVRSPRVVGDPVRKNETTLAILQPTMPAFIDERSRSELQAALNAAQSAIDLSEHEIRRLEAERKLAESELARARALTERGVLPAEKLDEARRTAEVSIHALAAAQSELEVQRSRHAAIEAQLAEPGDFGRDGGDPRELLLTAPISGEVLRVLQKSEAVVAAGTPLIELADTSDLEIQADLLSTDAVQVEPRASARVIGWGGPPLDARVTRVDPTGFDKISALGIEELRVPVILELTGPKSEWTRLKHNFRVTVEITLARAEDALLVPSAALFRHGDAWAVFASDEGRARLRVVTIGLSNDSFAKVVGGLSDGDRVVLYPDERIYDGAKVAERVER